MLSFSVHNLMAILTLDVRSAAKMSRKHKHLYKNVCLY